MKRTSLALALIAGAWIMLAVPSPSIAQSPIRRPILSPYLQLLRPRQGPLPNYQNFVEPHLQLERTRVRQFENELRFEQQLLQQRRDVGEFITELTRPTGGRSAATYMNYLHFYPQASQFPVRRRF